MSGSNETFKTEGLKLRCEYIRCAPQFLVTIDGAISQFFIDKPTENSVINFEK